MVLLKRLEAGKIVIVVGITHWLLTLTVGRVVIHRLQVCSLHSMICLVNSCTFHNI